MTEEQAVALIRKCVTPGRTWPSEDDLKKLSARERRIVKKFRKAWLAKKEELTK